MANLPQAWLASASSLRNLDTSFFDSVQQSTAAAEGACERVVGCLLAVPPLDLGNCYNLPHIEIELAGRTDYRLPRWWWWRCVCMYHSLTHSLTFTVNAVARLTNFAFRPALGANSLLALSALGSRLTTAHSTYLAGCVDVWLLPQVSVSTWLLDSIRAVDRRLFGPETL